MRNRISIALPEETWIDYAPAGFGSRGLAYITDFTIRWTLFGLFALILLQILSLSGQTFSFPTAGTIESLLGETDTPITVLIALVSLIFFLVEWSYPIYFEVCHQGVTPGKRIFGLRVVDTRGLPITLRSSLLRTIFLLVDLLPGLPIVGFAFMFFSGKRQRVGDLIAQTLVTYDRKESFPLMQERSEKPILLSLEEFTILEEYRTRREELSESVREQMALRLRDHLTCVLRSEDLASLPEASATDAWLLSLWSRAEPTRFGSSQTQSAPGRWHRMQKELRDAAEHIDSFNPATASEEGIKEVAQAYQVACQKLAYLSTFYPSTALTRFAASIVRSGRGLIYGKRLGHWKSTQGVSFLRRVPESFVGIRPYALTSTVVAVLSGALCYLMVDLNPNLGWHFLSEEAMADLSSGVLWTDDVHTMSSLASSKIMTNNIKVSVLAFALGIFAGFGTIFILIINGALIGGMFSVLSRFDMATPLLEFMSAHGFIEISIIMVAAGAGLYLGDGFLRPGPDSRLRALQHRARPALDVVLFSAIGLVPAGVVEGYISSRPDIPAVMKVGIGLLLAIVYWILLLRRPSTKELGAS